MSTRPRAGAASNAPSSHPSSNNMTAPDQRKPYTGDHRSLVIALDVGTTFSGVSYAILEPREVPKIHGVTRFPGQEHVVGNSKIPSILYYDRYGKMQAAGAEAEGVEIQAEDEGWTKAELFKLRLRPRAMRLEMNGMTLAPLPYKKTAVDVFADFLGYLFKCTRNFIIDTHANGRMLWRNVEHDVQFVLSHPNGWEGAQQAKMRRAAIYGGLIPDTSEGKARIRFVTEGEASLHACVLNGLAADVLSNPSRPGFIVADAGGGTLDISSYAIKGTSPLVIEEIAPPDCVFAGSVFVSRRARFFLEDKLKTSKYGTADALDHITKRFDETTKRLFREKRDLQFIPFGSPLDKDTAVGIRAGQLKLTGEEVANLFEPSVEAAVTAIKTQIDSSRGVIKFIWLVGGFAASPWLFSQLQERLAVFDVIVSRPDSQTSKAVADGAIGFWCDHHVNARVSKFYYGVEYLREFDPNNAEHVARKDRLCELPSGPKLLPDAFDCILARNTRVKESTVFTRKYCTELTSLNMLSVFEVEVWCYRGSEGIPPWILRQAENFSTLCVVRANLSPLSGSAQPKEGRNGTTYWTIVFSVEIHFGLTEFKARIKWVDPNGKIKYGPAAIVYNESGHRADEDEPDILPEDDEITGGGSGTRRPRNRSEAPSRAISREPSPSRPVPSPIATEFLAPPADMFPPAQPPSSSGIPEVHRLSTENSGDRSRSLGNGTASRAPSSVSRTGSVSTSKPPPSSHTSSRIPTAAPSSRAPTAAPTSPTVSRSASRAGSESERERSKGKERTSSRSDRLPPIDEPGLSRGISAPGTPASTRRGMTTPKPTSTADDAASQWGFDVPEGAGGGATLDPISEILASESHAPGTPRDLSRAMSAAPPSPPPAQEEVPALEEVPPPAPPEPEPAPVIPEEAPATTVKKKKMTKKEKLAAEKAEKEAAEKAAAEKAAAEKAEAEAAAAAAAAAAEPEPEPEPEAPAAAEAVLDPLGDDFLAPMDATNNVEDDAWGLMDSGGKNDAPISDFDFGTSTAPVTIGEATNDLLSPTTEAGEGGANSLFSGGFGWGGSTKPESKAGSVAGSTWGAPAKTAFNAGSAAPAWGTKTASNAGSTAAPGGWGTAPKTASNAGSAAGGGGGWGATASSAASRISGLGSGFGLGGWGSKTKTATTNNDAPPATPAWGVDTGTTGGGNDDTRDGASSGFGSGLTTPADGQPPISLDTLNLGGAGDAPAEDTGAGAEAEAPAEEAAVPAADPPAEAPPTEEAKPEEAAPATDEPKATGAEDEFPEPAPKKKGAAKDKAETGAAAKKKKGKGKK